ncbi:SDR family oxidoreductase [bacterium]|nr:SDR family oxidoreductase [bacterium]MBU1636910.1 SDR family oxidoreductase [bacterium]MBU1920104.1 SDR family oxidoreductase [bacterium]
MEPLDFSAKTSLIAGVSADMIEIYRSLIPKAGKAGLMSRNEKKLDQLMQRLIGWGVDAASFRADVTDSASVLEAFREFSVWSKRLDVFIYNVGVVSNESASEVTESELSRVMSANFFGFVNCFQLVMPMMKKTGGGQAVIISGSSALEPERESVAYAASNASLQIYTKALRRELAGTGIQITELYLGKMQSGAGWRWLTCEEIVAGVLRALSTVPDRLTIGTMKLSE